MTACKGGHFDTIQFLLLKNANVNKVSVNNNGRTALSFACAGGKYDIVILLLEYNADPYHESLDGSTMVIEAAKGGYTNIIKLLLNYPQSMIKNPPEPATLPLDVPLNKTVLPKVQDITDNNVESCKPDKKHNANSSTQDPMIMKAQLNASNSSSSSDCQVNFFFLAV